MAGLAGGVAKGQEASEDGKYVTLNGVETLSNKSVSGPLSIHTNGGRIGITSGNKPLGYVGAVVHVENRDSVTCGIRATSYWAGTTKAPYQNNDCSLWEVFNDTQSDSLNRSWAGSFANAYNHIPEGVTDSGTRVGVIGWAVSVNHDGYGHKGTLAQQTGLQGSAGFQSAGSGASAVTRKATGVYGVIYSDSDGATIEDARAGEFYSVPRAGHILNNIAVYGEAAGGEKSNFSFYGAAGNFFNSARAYFGTLIGQAKALVYVRSAGNAVEFGHPDPQGYASTLGATPKHGFPFLALCAEADPTDDKYTTRGRPGAIIWNDLTGAMVFSRLPNAKAPGQTPVENGRFDPDGHLRLANTPYLPGKTPASANAPGKAGEICWDSSFVFVCIAENTWRRAALASW